MTLSRLRLTKCFAALGLLCALPVSTAAAADEANAPASVVEIDYRTTMDDGTILARLTNGMQVIVRAVRTSPVVCVRAYVRTGGLYEGPWLGCGISHLVEHLVAKGAAHDMGDQTAAEAKQTRGRVEEIGGQSNAYTSMDHTCYYISATSGRTMDCIRLVADWMARPKILKEDFEREHGVVQRELELGKDNPDRQFYYANAANIFGTHPAAVPVIGYARPLAALTYQDVLDYHARSYVAQNMLFIVVGDVDTEACLAEVVKSFQGFAAGRTFEHVLPEVARLTGVRRATVSSPLAKGAVEEISFQTISLMHEDLYALDLLDPILSGGTVSRLVLPLVRQKKLAASVDTSSWTPQWGRGAFSIEFRADPNLADQAEGEILGILRQIAAEGVAEEDLVRAKRIKASEFARSQQSVEAISAQMATDWLSTGDVRFSKHYNERIQKVTLEQVNAAAKKYFDFDAMSVTRMLPTAVAEQAGAAQHAAAKERTQAFKLDNGLRVVLQPTDDLELVSLVLTTAGGLLAEDASTNGMGTAMARGSTGVAGDRPAEEISEFFVRAGGGVTGACGNNSWYWQASALADSFDGVIEMFADIVVRPKYTEKELAIARPRLIRDAMDANDNILAEGFQNARRVFFHSPYALLSTGRVDVLKKMTAQQLQQWHDRWIRAGDSVLVVVGRFDSNDARKRIEKAFADMPPGHNELPKGAAPAEAAKAPTVIPADKAGAAVLAMLPSTTVPDLADNIPLTVLDTIISGYRLPSGWLHTELRGKQLVYVVHAYNWPGMIPGAFITYAACQPEKAPEVVQIIRENLAKAAHYTPTQEEIDLAVNSILTAELLGNQRVHELAMSAALDELYGLGWDYRRKMEQLYRKVTPADVARVGKKFFSAEPVFVVTTPDPNAFKEAQ